MAHRHIAGKRLSRMIAALAGVALALLITVRVTNPTPEDERAGEGLSADTDSRTLAQTIDELSDKDSGAAEALDGAGKALEGLGLDGLQGSQGWTSVRQETGDLTEVAQNLLASYRDEGNCILAQSGYLDLLGSVWGCVVFGGDWADVCVIGAADEGACQVRVLRLDRDELASLLENEEYSEE